MVAAHFISKLQLTNLAWWNVQHTCNSDEWVMVLWVFGEVWLFMILLFTGLWKLQMFSPTCHFQPRTAGDSHCGTKWKVFSFTDRFRWTSFNNKIILEQTHLELKWPTRHSVAMQVSLEFKRTLHLLSAIDFNEQICPMTGSETVQCSIVQDSNPQTFISLRIDYDMIGRPNIFVISMLSSDGWSVDTNFKENLRRYIPTFGQMFGF